MDRKYCCMFTLRDEEVTTPYLFALDLKSGHTNVPTYIKKTSANIARKVHLY